MKLEDVKPGAWVIYTAGHPRFGNSSRIGQIGQIIDFCKYEEDLPIESKNVEVAWMRALHPTKETGGVYRENIELLGQ
jgi:hypothetical protein